MCNRRYAALSTAVSEQDGPGIGAQQVSVLGAPMVRDPARIARWDTVNADDC